MSSQNWLWYDQPAPDFNASLPIGNGRLGAMVAGQVHHEVWTVNEDSIWSGGPMNRIPVDAVKSLPRLRRLVMEDRLQDAEQLVCRAFYGAPESMRHYEVAGQVKLDFHHGKGAVSGYKRWLDINEAITGCKYTIGNTEFTREVLASYDHNVICARFSASQPNSLSFDLRLARGENLNVFCDSITCNDGILTLHTQQPGKGVLFSICTTVCVGHGESAQMDYPVSKSLSSFADSLGSGRVRWMGDTLIVEEAQQAEIYISVETTFRHQKPIAKCHELLWRSAKSSYAVIRSSHIVDYQALAGRCTLRLGNRADSEVFLQRPTNAWIADTRASDPHPCLIALLFQFGSYLLISSSRDVPNALPANLQGIWNDSRCPQWGSKFTININAEMNYWPAETCNLSSCHKPLFALIRRLAVRGEDTARNMYGCRGWASHHNTDIWADAGPQDRWLPATLWVMSGAWLCLHIWDHFLFTLDHSFLSEHIDILRGSVTFYLDFLTDHDGYKVTNPSLSPENAYRLPNGEEGCISFSPAIDTQILRHLFNAYLAATKVLRPATARDADFIHAIETAASQLPDMKIGSHGQLQEWYHDYEEVEPGHRHVSHLWDIFPGTGISTRNVKLQEACKVTLARRAAHGGGHTGWSRAWMIALAARLMDGESARDHITKLLNSSTLPSLLNDHPLFQIDGNFGSVAAIAEMLVQSHTGAIVLLPALPSQWHQGKVTGICARGGFEITMEWEHGRLSWATLLSKNGGSCRITYKIGMRILQDEREIASQGEEHEVVSFITVPSTSYRIILEEQSIRL